MKRLILFLMFVLLVVPAWATNDTLTVQTCSLDGIAPSFTSAADTVYFVNNGYTVLEVKNASGSEITVTLISRVAANYPDLPAGAAASNPTVTVAATTGDKIIGPFNQRSFNDSNGYVMVTFSAKTSVTVNTRKVSSR